MDSVQLFWGLSAVYLLLVVLFFATLKSKGKKHSKEQTNVQQKEQGSNAHVGHLNKVSTHPEKEKDTYE